MVNLMVIIVVLVARVDKQIERKKKKQDKQFWVKHGGVKIDKHTYTQYFLGMGG